MSEAISDDESLRRNMLIFLVFLPFFPIPKGCYKAAFIFVTSFTVAALGKARRQK